MEPTADRPLLDAVVLHDGALFNVATDVHRNPDCCLVLSEEQSFSVAAVVLEMTTTDMECFLQAF